MHVTDRRMNVAIGGPVHGTQLKVRPTDRRVVVPVIPPLRYVSYPDPCEDLRSRGYQEHYYTRESIAFKVSETEAHRVYFWAHSDLGGERGAARFWEWLMNLAEESLASQSEG